MDDAAATQRLLDELHAVDGADDDARVTLALSPVDNDLVPWDDALLSPTAQLFTFFADDHAPIAAETEAAVARSPPPSTSSVSTQLVLSNHKKKKRKAKRTSTYDSNRARNERRHELAYLRRRVTEMENQLETLKAQSATSSALVTVVPPTPVRAVKSVWEQIAGRQRDERARAERENVRLRAALATQLKVAKSLECLLHKPALFKSFEGVGLGRHLITSRGNETVIDAADQALLAQMLAHVEEIYAQADALVTSASLNTGIRAASRGSLVEIVATDCMPFALDAASHAAWTYFSYKKNHLPVPSRLYYERHNVESLSVEDTVVESSGMERLANGLSAIVKLKQVLRRYHERERVVIAWSAVSQPVELGGQPFHGYDLREWGCMVLTPERQDPDALSPLTVLRSCYFITPEMRAGDATHCDIGQLTECVLGFTTARMSTWRQRIENILIDNQLAASRSSA